MYRPIQYVDYQSLPGCKLSRRTSRTAKNDMFSSRYGMRKDMHGIRCGQYDDAPCHRFGTGYGGCRFTAANSRGNIRRSFSRSSTPKRKAPRFHELATAKKSRCGPNCKYSRCAANDPCYAVPFYTPNERQDRRGTKKSGPIPSPSLLRNTCSRMAQIREISKRVGDNMTMGLKYLQDPRILDVLPMFELRCDGNCAECSDTENRPMSRESIRGRAGHGDEIPERISTRNPNETGLKSMTTKTVASNTERSCYEPPEFPEPPTRTLKDVNSNSTLERLNKQTSPIPIDIKTPTPTPIPRVSLLRPPRPAPPQNLTKKDQQMIRYALRQQERLQTPQPKYGHVVESPSKHEANPPLPPPIPLHGHEAPPQPTPEIPPFHSLTSRREGTTPVRLHPLRETWLPGKISPRLRTPPIVKMTYPTRTPSISLQSPQSPQSPQSQSTQHQTLNPSPNPNPKSPPQNPFSPSPSQNPSQQTSPPPITKSFQAISLLTSNYDSDNITATTTTTMDSNSTSETLTMCLCRKSENALAMTKGVYKNNNNPLYNLASPLQSPGRDPATMGSNPSRARLFALEVLVLLVLGGLVTLGLMSFVENVFKAYLAGNCRCSGGAGKGVELMADGLKSGVVNWITCPMDESRVQLTPVR